VADTVTLRIVAACSPGEVRAAVTQNDQLIDYALWRPGAPDGVGDLHRGRIVARVPAMAGAFVALAEGSEGFLPDSAGGGRAAGAAGATEGDPVHVRVTRAAQGGKGPRLTARLEERERLIAQQSGPGPPALLRRGPGAVELFAARYPEASIVVDDPGFAAQLRPLLGSRVSVGRLGFDEALSDQVERLAEPSVALASGAVLHFHPTPALVAIDVDAGGNTAARRGKTAAQLATNRSMIPELARQIRLRDLSGAILVDFAGLSPRRRAVLGPALAAALADDPLQPRLLGFTALGLAEIVRQRIHPPLHELLASPHAAGLAALRQIAAEIAARPHLAPVLRAAPAVAAALRADPVALADLARRAGRPLILRTDPALPFTGWTMEHENDRPGR
jgi:Ribonuclease G/E